MLHRLFQRHHLLPDEVYAMEWRKRKFVYASEEIALDEEIAEAKRNKKK